MLIFSGYTTIMVHCQEPSVRLSDKISFKTKREKKPLLWKFSAETEISNNFRAPNDIPLVNSSTASNKIILISEKANQYKLRLEENFAAPTNRDSSKFFESLEIFGSKSINKMDLSLNGSYFHSQLLSFATLGPGLSRQFHLAKNNTVTVFSQFDWYVPTESKTNRFNPGVVWTNGANLQTRLGFTNWNVSEKLIIDSGAILPGKRFGLNSEVSCLFPFGPFRIGPKINYSNFFVLHSPDGASPKKLSYGLVFKVGQ